MTTKMKYREKNPLIISNPKIEALEEAQKIFLEVIDEYAKNNRLGQNELKELKEILQSIYFSKKLHYLLEHKMSIFSNYLDFATNFALKESSTSKSFTNVFYLKHTRQLLTNEQY
jgi:hypothetical protein